ncbi:hypothetical protein EJ08DRAFT_655446 [Tothia fuscella]|uniref:Uncharacterized protein n=1 Tax=Tothia fuscella TaxID=1048955 RepID=A0A9P4P3B1_9PEZI|nr:hypothetical protein EJ08DRAFT_655446 [Tothia fuscella]
MTEKKTRSGRVSKAPPRLITTMGLKETEIAKPVPIAKPEAKPKAKKTAKARKAPGKAKVSKSKPKAKTSESEQTESTVKPAKPFIMAATPPPPSRPIGQPLYHTFFKLPPGVKPNANYIKRSIRCELAKAKAEKSERQKIWERNHQETCWTGWGMMERRRAVGPKNSKSKPRNRASTSLERLIWVQLLYFVLNIPTFRSSDKFEMVSSHIRAGEAGVFSLMKVTPIREAAIDESSLGHVVED